MEHKAIEDMTQDEKIDEILLFTRAVSELLEVAAQHPMLSMMLPKV